MEMGLAVYGIETRVGLLYSLYIFSTLQPRLMFTVCTSEVPERVEVKWR